MSRGRTAGVAAPGITVADLIDTLESDLTPNDLLKITTGQGSCAGALDPETWTGPAFERVVAGRSERAYVERAAASACQDCPLVVRQACLAYALATRATHGVWGGVPAHALPLIQRRVRTLTERTIAPMSSAAGEAEPTVEQVAA